MSTFGGKSGLRLELYDIDGAENRGYNSKELNGSTSTYKAFLNNSPSSRDATSPNFFAA